MSEALALSRLRDLAAASQVPALTDGQLLDCIRDARLADAAGLVPGAVGWVFTVDLNLAAARAWELKAALAAGMFDFSADGARFNRKQVQEACLAQAQVYRRRRNTSFDTEMNLEVPNADAL